MENQNRVKRIFRDVFEFRARYSFAGGDEGAFFQIVADDAQRVTDAHAADPFAIDLIVACHADIEREAMKRRGEGA